MTKKLDLIFNVFSRRRNPTGSALPKLPETFRNRVFLLCRDTFSGKNNPYSSGNYLDSFWNEIHSMLTYRLGRPRLEPSRASDNLIVDVLSFLAVCKDEEFLDFIEYIFKVDCLFHVVNDENDFVAQINKFFALDGLSYELTDFVTEEQPSGDGSGEP